MGKKRTLVVSYATYRGVQILESEGRFVVYLGTYRHEFDTLPQTTEFIDKWVELKNN